MEREVYGSVLYMEQLSSAVTTYSRPIASRKPKPHVLTTLTTGIKKYLSAADQVILRQQGPLKLSGLDPQFTV